VSGPTVRVRLLFADEGSFYHEEIRIPAGTIERYERLIDLIREDEEVLRRVFVDLDRLCSAAVMEE
jgi:hypothetical protein